MASWQRPGEITYYEQLGVEDTASATEIRDAFRALVRLLHPDQQTDPQLKEMAESQMRKLNRIHAVLSDSARRTAYDQSLNADRHGPVIVFSGSDGNLKKLLMRGGSVAAVLTGALLLIWFIATGSNPEVRGQEARLPLLGKTSYAADLEAGDQIMRLRDQLRTAERERDSALEQLGRLGKKTGPALARGRAAHAQTASSSAPPDASTPGGPAQVASAALPMPDEPGFNAAQFAGLWVYSKGSASPGGKSQYPPEFIEVTMTEKNGALHGQYHSRYQVLDHAISPDVDFVFNGTPNGTALNCAWEGPGGASGQLTMKLMPASTVEIAWNAKELGSTQWLVNGTATLIKK